VFEVIANLTDEREEDSTRKDEGKMKSRAKYTIKMRRKTLFYTVNLIIPSVLVSSLSMVVFYLPATAGERITMSVSILLALVVYLQVRTHGWS
jgi:nicotinic acetylcholine receptor, invertebrate